MWQYQNTDELYHYGRVGMKWGQHIFGDKYVYRSREQKNVARQLKKLNKTGRTKSANYTKLKNKLRKLKTRDNKTLSEYRKELLKKKAEKAVKKQTQKEANKLKKQTQKENKELKKQGTKNLSDNELRKQNDRLRLENEYFRLKSEYDRNKAEAGKSSVSKVIDKIGKRILEPAATEATKAVLQDLLTKVGRTANTQIDNAFREQLKSLNNESKMTKTDKKLENLDNTIKNLNKEISVYGKNNKIKELKTELQNLRKEELEKLKKKK